MERGGGGTVAFCGVLSACKWQSHRQDRQSFPRQERQHHQTSTSASVSSLTTRALVSGCSSSRGRASCCGRTGSIFLLISATVSAFAFLSLVVLLVGHCTGFGCQCYCRPLSAAAVNAVGHFCGLHVCCVFAVLLSLCCCCLAVLVHRQAGFVQPWQHQLGGISCYNL